MNIVLTKLNTWGVHLLVNGNKVVMREGDIFVDGKVIHNCRFCGREFDHEEYVKTMTEQAPSRDPAYFRSEGARYCGLYCAWLSDPDFCRRQLTKDDKLDVMKEDVAKRVAKFLKNKK